MSLLSLATTALLAALLGAAVAVGLAPLARLMRRIWIGTALLISVCVPFAFPLLVFAGAAVFLGPPAPMHPTAMGPGAGTGAAILVLAIVLAGVVFASLLLATRWTGYWMERFLTWVAAAGAALGWAAAGLGRGPLWRSEWEAVCGGLIFFGVSLLAEHLAGRAVFRSATRPGHRQRLIAAGTALVVCVTAVGGSSILWRRNHERRIAANDVRVARDLETTLVEELAGLAPGDAIVRRHGSFVRLADYRWNRTGSDLIVEAVAEFDRTDAPLYFAVGPGDTKEVRLEVTPPESELGISIQWPGRRRLEVVGRRLMVVYDLPQEPDGYSYRTPQPCGIMGRASHPDFLSR